MSMGAITRKQKQEGPSTLATIGKIGAVVGTAIATAATAGAASPALGAVGAGLATAGGVAQAADPGGEMKGGTGPTGQQSAMERRISQPQTPGYAETSSVLKDSLMALREAAPDVQERYRDPLVKAYIQSARLG